MTTDNIVDAVSKKYQQSSLALGGCRTTDMSMECCEYDFLVLSTFDNYEQFQFNGDYAEIHTLGINHNKTELALFLANVEIINDKDWKLVSLKRELAEKKVIHFEAYARKLAMDGLFYANKSRRSSSSLESSMWLKCAAYCILEAIIVKNGSNPMPLHLLKQLRLINNSSDSKGIMLANSCLGIERANKSSVARSMEATIGLVQRLKASEANVITRKAEFLNNTGMYPDCYSYLGKVTKDAVTMIAHNERRLKDFHFIIGIAMDLTNDESTTYRLGDDLMDFCKTFLRK